MTNASIKNWLRRSPQPVRVRADGRDLAIPQTPSKWADLAETLEGIGASQVEALDSEGRVLRALSLATVADAPDPEIVREEREQKAERSRAAETAEITRVIIEGIDKATQRHSEMFNGVMNTMMGILRISTDRLATMERGYSAAMLSMAKAQQDAILADAERRAAEIQQQGEGDSAMVPVMMQLAGSLLSPPDPPKPPPPNPEKK
jgi:hypothetical protein